MSGGESFLRSRRLPLGHPDLGWPKHEGLPHNHAHRHVLCTRRHRLTHERHQGQREDDDLRGQFGIDDESQSVALDGSKVR